MRKEAARLLALYVANLIRTLDPELVIIGGGAGNRQLIKDANNLLPNYGCKKIIRQSKLGARAQVMGAVALLQ
jgi:predicted NBD/HSP70 family sugar kinase